jgi:hypothetical protein
MKQTTQKLTAELALMIGDIGGMLKRLTGEPAAVAIAQLQLLEARRVLEVARNALDEELERRKPVSSAEPSDADST